MSKRIVFTGQREVILEKFECCKPSPTQVRVAAIHTLMSTGTEGICYGRLFDAGTNWDRWVKYPFYPGYSFVGRVEECGAQVNRVAVGDLIVARLPHASHHVLEQHDVTPVPTGIEPAAAVWFALAKIGAMGARAAQYQIGDNVLILGAGPIGQMSVRWAFALGVESIIVADPAEARLPFATRGGATGLISRPITDALDELQSLCQGERPRVTIDSTGHPQAFAAALAAAADRGRVVLLGDTGTPVRQTLTSDLLNRGLTIIGTHDCHHDHHQWSPQRITRLFFSLVTTGRFRLGGINTHTFAPADCKEAYEFAARARGETMGILFDW